MARSAEVAAQNSTGSRVRFPISLKVSLAVSAVVVLIVLGFVVSSVLATRNQYAQAAERLKTSQIDALAQRGLESVRNMAGSAAAPLLDGDVSRVRDNVDAVSKDNPDVVECIALRSDGRIIARAGQGSLGDKVGAPFLAELGKLEKATTLKGLWDGGNRKAIAYAAPITLSGRNLGFMYLELSTAKIEATLAAIERERVAAVTASIAKSLGIGAVALAVGILVAVFLGLRFSGAVRHLAAVASEVGRGNMQARAKAASNDELGVLANRFNDMTDKIDRLMKDTVKKAAIEQELQRASAIQALLVPSIDVAEHAGLQYCGFIESAAQVGGDWWHHYRVSDTKVLLCVGDVTGHGIPSAMLTASAKASCDTLLRDNKNIDLVTLLKALDYVIQEAGKGELVMTFFALLIDTQAKTMTYANAGHNFPLLLRGNKVKPLIARGGRLGDGLPFEVSTHDLAENDLVVLFSDGLIECENAEGQAWGQRRFIQTLRNNASADVRDVRTRVVEGAYNYFGATPRADDITLVVCRVNTLARERMGQQKPPAPPVAASR